MNCSELISHIFDRFILGLGKLRYTFVYLKFDRYEAQPTFRFEKAWHAFSATEAAAAEASILGRTIRTDSYD